MIRLTAVLLVCAAFTAGAEEYPHGQLSRDVVPQRYALALDIDPRKTTFSGTADIDVVIGQPTQRIWLHGRGLRVSAATLSAGDATLPLTYTEVDTVNGVARLDSATRIAAGPATLHLTYEADFGRGMSGIGRLLAGDEAYVFTQMEPIDARAAFPGFDDPQFKTPFEVTVVAPEGDFVVSNARLVSRGPAGKGLVRHRFAPTLPLPTYLVAFAVGPLAVAEGQPIAAHELERPPIPQRGIATRGQGSKLTYVLEHTPAIVTALEDYFGIAYPYPKLDQIASPDMPGAMENAGAVIYGDSLLLLGADAPPAQLRGFYEVAAHELAHQWFGDLVTPRWWDDIWLNEAFASWMGAKIAHQLRPDLSPATTITDDALLAMVTDSQQAGRPIRQPISDNSQITTAFDDITYKKGGGVLSMIESYIGPEKFRDGVRLHLGRHLHGSATADDFFAAMAEAAKDPAIIDAFRSFVEQPGLPLVTVERHANALSLAQSRYAPTGSTIAQGQLWKIPLCVNFYGERATAKRCTLMRGRHATMGLPQGIGAIDAVMPNAGGAGYYRFALDEASAAALLARGTSLPDSEALVLADSIKGGFASGNVTLDTLLDAMASLASHPSRQVSTSLGLEAHDIANRMLDDAQRQVLERRIGAAYGPQLAKLGVVLDAAGNAGDSAETRLLRRALLFLVGVAGRDADVRAQLAAAAAKSLQDPAWLDSGLRDRVWTVGVQEKVPGVVDALVKALTGDDSLAREQAAFALGLADDADVAERLRSEVILDTRVPASQAMTILAFQLAQPVTRAAAWQWMQQSAGPLGERLPQFARQFLLQLPAQAFCDRQSAADVKAFAERKVKEYGQGELVAARAVESIELCAASKAQHTAEFVALTAD
ncbi:MAG: M1 family metallopeptidase [Steroidobacteraceae bacterium]|nr:M1 family metallopeptidase [Steroidobacteraceae bacterium]